MVSRERAAGPVVLVDAGDALSRAVHAGNSPLTPEERTGFGLILDAMGELRYDAMAVGERDLALGVEELQKRAAAAKVTLLAANVVDKKGKRPFGERKLVEAGGVKVGIFAVTGGDAFAANGLKVLPPLKSAAEQAKALRKAGAQLVVALLHLEYGSALDVANKLEGVDYAVQSHDGRVSSTQLVGKTILTGGGERGRQLGRAEFEVGSSGGPLFDRAEAKSARQQLGFLEQTIAQNKQTLKNLPEGSSRDQQQRLLDTLAKRREELLTRMEAEAPPGRSSVLTELVTLDRRVPEDPEMAKRLGTVPPSKLH